MVLELNWSTSEGWKTESTLEPRSGDQVPQPRG